MTAPLSHQTISVKDAAAVRKRRRRAPAGGAADDCFTCTKRNVKCDRRRPYCSQCLEVGNECSGYKTQLTWGVGVASRGKLRGLSLPIAKAPPVTREPKKSPIGRARANSTSSTIHAHWPEQDTSRRMQRSPMDIPSISQGTSGPTTPYTVAGYDYLSMSHPENSPAVPQGSWNSVQYSPSIVHSPNATPKYSRFTLPIITDGLSSSVDTVSDVDYLSPLSQGYPRDEMPFVSNSPTGMYDSYSTQQPSPGSHGTAAPCPSLVYAPSEPSSSLTSHMDPFETHLGHKMMRECDSLNVPEVDSYNSNCNAAGSVWASSRGREDEQLQSPQSDHAPQHHWPLIRQPRPGHASQDYLAKMPFFMDYYKITIAPSMVYIDGPGNPFRDQILRLATNSQCLQHAICALSACNLRMKRRLSLGHDLRELSEKLMTEKQALDSVGDTPPEDPALSEEFQHRNMAVQLLNDQLNDPVKSTHDSVLATILLLCHYRMVESGIAKFHTQFAGVKKILEMKRSQRFESSHGTAWIEALFVYFDAISASINDREAQLVLGLEGVSAELPVGAENMVGCERGLFKTIGKLGRLNLLSQHRPVQNLTLSPRLRDDTPQAQSPTNTSMGHGYRGSVSSIHSQQSLGSMYNVPGQRFDGNGFGSTLDDDEILSSAMGSTTSYDDHRNLFWREWRETRQALQNWQFDASTVAASLPGSPNPAEIRDLGALSEAFRYAALLYTERLAAPTTPSSHTNFQNLVSQVVYYATSLETGSTADKFLLWPLFVAGSECVNELQQKIVRSRCSDIMRRSGYMNNLAALDVLEKLWSGDFTSSDEVRSHGSKLACARGPFNWAKCFGGPGAGVEWIMF